MNRLTALFLFLCFNFMVYADYADHGKYYSVSHSNYGGVFVFIIFVVIAVVIIRSLSNFFGNSKKENNPTSKVHVQTKNEGADYAEGYFVLGCFFVCLIIAIFGITFCH